MHFETSQRPVHHAPRERTDAECWRDVLADAWHHAPLADNPIEALLDRVERSR